MGYAREWELIRILQDAYLSNDFTLIEPYLAEDCMYQSYLNTGEARSKEEVMQLFRKKAEEVIEIGVCRHARLGRIADSEVVIDDAMNESEFRPLIVAYDEEERSVQAIILIRMQEDGLIYNISVAATHMYNFEIMNGYCITKRELYFKALDIVQKLMHQRGYMEIFREGDRVIYPNMVFLKDNQPVEAALRVTVFPYQGTLSPAYIDSMQRQMSPQRERLFITVQFRNLSDPKRPWSMDIDVVLGETVEVTAFTNELD
jgi:hypothetical protein